MLNAKAVGLAIVERLRDVPSLVRRMMDADPANIRYFKSAFPGPPEEDFPGRPALRHAIQGQPPGSIIVVYTGQSQSKYSGSYYLTHKFSLGMRVAESLGDETYEDLCYLITEGIVESSGLPFRLTDLIPPYPFKAVMDYPDNTRESIPTGDSETLDYFVMSLNVTEI